MNLELNPVAGIISSVGKVADDLFTSDKERLAAELDSYTAETTRMNGQVDLNKIEGASDSFFKSGWRPSIGWVCSVTLALSYIPKAMVLAVFWCISAYHAAMAGTVLPVYPDLGLTDLLGLLFSMLGIGTMRSWDKKNLSKS